MTRMDLEEVKVWATVFHGSVFNLKILVKNPVLPDKTGVKRCLGNDMPACIIDGRLYPSTGIDILDEEELQDGDFDSLVVSVD